METDLLLRLGRASVQKPLEPEQEIDWSLPLGKEDRVLPEEVLSLADLQIFESMTDEMRLRLARNEVAAAFSVFIRFEQTLTRGLARRIEGADPLEVDLPYFLHVIEEEARHNRMFMKAISRLGEGSYPARGLLGFLQRRLMALTRSFDTLFFLSVLAVEEITDQLLRIWTKADGSHPLIRQIGRLHGIEEARHKRFSETYLREAYTSASWATQRITELLAPFVVVLVFDVLTPPSVYLRSGIAHSRIQAFRLWWAARSSEGRRSLRTRTATQLIRTLESTGVIRARTSGLWSLLGLPVNRPEGS